VQGLQGLASVSRVAKDLDVAEPLYRAALDLSREHFGDHPTVANALHMLGQTLTMRKNYDEASSVLEQALELRVKLLGTDHPDTVSSRGLLCSTLVSKGNHAGALPLRRELLAGLEARLDENDPQVIRAKESLAHCLHHLRRYAECEPIDRDVLSRRAQLLAPDHKDLLKAKRSLGVTLFAQKKFAEAEPLFHDAWTGYKNSEGDDNPTTVQVLRQFADTLRELGKFTEAEPLHRQLLDDYERRHGTNSLESSGRHRELANILWHTRKFAEGIEHARALVRIVESVPDVPRTQVGAAYQFLAWWLAFCPDATLRMPTEAVELAQRSVEIDPKRSLNWQTLGIAQYAAGEFERAVESLNKSREVNRSSSVLDYLMISLAHTARDDISAARSSYEQAMQLWTKQNPRNADFDRVRAEVESALKQRRGQ